MRKFFTFLAAILIGMAAYAQDPAYKPYDLNATPLGRDTVLFEWKADANPYYFSISLYDETGNTIPVDMPGIETDKRSAKVATKLSEPTKVDHWILYAEGDDGYSYTQGEGFTIAGDDRIPHNLQVSHVEGEKYKISWAAGEGVDHFYLSIDGLETPVVVENQTAKSYEVNLPDNGYYQVEVASRDAENASLGIARQDINTYTTTPRDLVLHFYIPESRGFVGTGGCALKWRDSQFAGNRLTALVAEGEEAPHWYKATIADFNRIAIRFSLINASNETAATQELVYDYAFGEYDEEGYFAVAENVKGELYFAQQEYYPWYPKDYTPVNMKIGQEKNQIIFQWESAEEVNYELKAYDKNGEPIIWTTTYAGDGNQYAYAMENAEPVELSKWSLSPQVSYNYQAALTGYYKEPFIVKPSPNLPKNLQIKDNGDGTYTFSWDKAENEDIKQYSLNVVDPSGNSVLGKYNLTTTTVTEPVQFIFSGRGAIKVSSLNDWGSSIATAIDSFTVEPVAAHDINIRVLINPMSGIDTSEGVEFQIKKDAKSGYEPVAATNDKYGWWKYTLHTTEPGAIVRMKGGWRELTVSGDTCVVYNGSSFEEESCDAHDDDYTPQNISVYSNNDGTYTIAWSMNYTEQVKYYRVNLYDANYNYYLNDNVNALQVKTPVLATAGNYTLSITVYNRVDDRIGMGMTNFEIKPVEAREIKLSVLAQPGSATWGAYTYNDSESDYTDPVVFTPAADGWQTAVFNTTDPAVNVRFKKDGWYYSEPKDFVIAENTCIEWDNKEFKIANCETAKLKDFTLSNLKVTDEGKGKFTFSWDCPDNPTMFNIRLMHADSSYIHWSNNLGGDDRSATYQFNTDSTMEIVWYLVPVMDGDYDNNYLWDYGVYGKNFTAEATMQKLANLSANRNVDGTWTIQWDKPSAAVYQYSVEVQEESTGNSIYYNNVTDNQCITGFIGKLGTHKVLVQAYDKDWKLLGTAKTTLTVTEVASRELTVRLLLHPDAEKEIQSMRYQSGPDMWDVTDPVDEGSGWYKYTFTSTMPAPDVVVMGFQPTIFSDTCLQFTSNRLYGASCDETARDCRILDGSMKAVSEAGRVTFTWSALDKSTSYEVKLYSYNKNYDYWDCFMSGMVNDNEYVYLVPDDKDGLEIKWSVSPRQPHELKDYEASEKVILHKSQIILSSPKALTTDSIHYRLSWACNTDTVQYQVHVRAGGYPYIDQQVTGKQFDFTALSGYQNYNWEVRAVTAAGEPLTAWLNAEPLNAKSSLRMLSNLQGSATGKTLTYSWNTAAKRVRAELWIELDTWSRTPVFPGGDSIITGNTFSITVEEDARYDFIVYAQVENTAGEFIDVYEDNRVYVNVFTDVKTYAVNVSTTTGGSFWGMNPSGEYPEGYEVMLRPNAEEGYRFVKWSDGVTEEYRRIKITSDTTLVALYEKIPEHKVVLAASEGGILKLGYYYSDRQITKLDTTIIGNWSTSIEAQPNEGYELYEWSDGYDATELRRYVNFDSDTAIMAVFKPFCYITMAASEGGRVQINGAKAYDKAKKAYQCSYGAEVTIKANPNDGYRFVKWSDGDMSVTRTFIVTKDLSLTAEFAEAGAPLDKYAVQILSNDIQLGEVSQLSGTYTEGDKLTITASPNEGALFTEWSDGNKEATRVITVSSDTILIAYFEYRRVTLTIKASAGGSVNAEEVNGTYNYGTIVSISAKADEHYHFVGWSDGNEASERMITLKEDMVLTATFAKQQYTITFLNADGSFIEANAWNYGDMPSCSVIPTMEPDDEWTYIFKGWTPEIKAVSGNAIYTAQYTKDPNPGQGVENVQSDKVQGTKIMINGQLYILYNDAMYNVQGAKVK